jgi:hypothetical protein
VCELRLFGIIFNYIENAPKYLVTIYISKMEIPMWAWFLGAIITVVIAVIIMMVVIYSTEEPPAVVPLPPPFPIPEDETGNVTPPPPPAPPVVTVEQAIAKALAESYGFYPTTSGQPGTCQGKVSGLYGGVVHMVTSQCDAMGGAHGPASPTDEVHCSMDAGRGGPLGIFPPTYSGGQPGYFTMQGKACRAFGGELVDTTLGDTAYGRCKGRVGPYADSRHYMVAPTATGSIGNIRFWAAQKKYCDAVGGAYGAANVAAGKAPADWYDTCDLGIKPLSAYQ